MTPEEIPQELLDILDRAAGKTHARTLAQILTRYDELIDQGDATFVLQYVRMRQRGNADPSSDT